RGRSALGPGLLTVLSDFLLRAGTAPRHAGKAIKTDWKRKKPYRGAGLRAGRPSPARGVSGPASRGGWPASLPPTGRALGSALVVGGLHPLLLLEVPEHLLVVLALALGQVLLQLGFEGWAVPPGPEGRRDGLDGGLDRLGRGRRRQIGQKGFQLRWQRLVRVRPPQRGQLLPLHGCDHPAPTLALVAPARPLTET